MAEDKKRYKYPSFVTGMAMAKYAWLDKWDPYQLKQGKEEHKLRTLLVDNEENRAFVKKVLDATVEHAPKGGIKLKKAWKNPFKFPEDLDEDDFVVQEGKDKPKFDEDHVGKIFFEAKTGYPVAMLSTEKDEKGNLIALAEGVKIMSGDFIKTKFTINPYDGLGSGVGFRLNAVQLIKKNSNFTAGAFSADEFGEEAFDDSEIPF